jgi:hypothetical protein
MAENTQLRDLIETTVSRPVVAEIDAIAQTLRARHEASILAILAYGSCIRGEHVTDTLVDFYVIVENYRSTHKNVLARIGNRILPPNVYYQECSFNNQIIRCKYAVVCLTQFGRKNAATTKNPYFWARFCQPVALVYARNEATRSRVIDALMCAVTTTLGEAQKLAPLASAHEMWTEILTQTYRTELRSERSNRAAEIVSINSAYFEAVHEAAITAQSPSPSPDSTGWLQRRIIGKTLSVLRLIKAAFTFDGGADYLTWKITRHSGVEITLTPWQRRHPILAAPKLFWQLYAKGAFR